MFHIPLSIPLYGPLYVYGLPACFGRNVENARIIRVFSRSSDAIWFLHNMFAFGPNCS